MALSGGQGTFGKGRRLSFCSNKLAASQSIGHRASQLELRHSTATITANAVRLMEAMLST
eukprot:3834310-Amphidinium_carterae.1